jgi:hypothetical protein
MCHVPARESMPYAPPSSARLTCWRERLQNIDEICSGKEVTATAPIRRSNGQQAHDNVLDSVAVCRCGDEGDFSERSVSRRWRETRGPRCAIDAGGTGSLSSSCERRSPVDSRVGCEAAVGWVSRLRSRSHRSRLRLACCTQAPERLEVRRTEGERSKEQGQLDSSAICNESSREQAAHVRVVGEGEQEK